MTPLARLIDAVKAANDWTDPVLVENARKRGHDLTKSNISRLRNEDPLISIKGSMISALAAGLRVSASQVAVAAVESMGITLPSYELPTVEQAIRLDATLADRDRKILIATVREIREQGSRHADQPATPADPPPATPPRTQGAPGEGEKSERVDESRPLAVYTGGPEGKLLPVREVEDIIRIAAREANAPDPVFERILKSVHGMMAIDPHARDRKSKRQADESEDRQAWEGLLARLDDLAKGMSDAEISQKAAVDPLWAAYEQTRATESAE